METVVRYTVVNQDGKPVIKAVPVRRWSDERSVSAEQPQAASSGVAAEDQTILRRIRRFRVLDIR